MADVETLIPAPPATRLNVADRLAEVARQFPGVTAVTCPRRYSPAYRSVRQGTSGESYATTTFAELEADVDTIARGLVEWGVPRGTRLALLVRPGIEFVTLVFALLRAGMVIVLVDPGLGRRNLIRCLAETEPEGFVAVGLAQAGRLWLRRKFPRARWNITVQGRRWFWGGLTLEQLRSRGTKSNALLPTTRADDPAAIIFTSGSTGPPKGVLYTQRMFDTQVSEIQSMYGIEPGGVDLACFALFALFNSAMGVTTVLPEMDFSRPASAKPRKLLAAANDWKVTQAFASPAVWRMLSAYCAKIGSRIPSLRQVFSCGAPVPAEVLRATLACVGDGAKMHTPYGMTEALPVATIEAAEVLSETAARTDEGAGVCVGRKFDSIDWRVIRITDEPITTITESEELPAGEIGELIVRGPQVSPRYVTRVEANAISKIGGGPITEYLVQSTQYGGGSPPSPLPTPPSTFAPWHRTGDVGYFDDQGRFWYCGRKSHRIITQDATLFSVPIESRFDALPFVKQSAFVGVGEPGRQVPVLFVVLKVPPNQKVVWWIKAKAELLEFADKEVSISNLVVYSCATLPVDARHNAKINREQLTVWATKRLRFASPQPPVPSP